MVGLRFYRPLRGAMLSGSCRNASTVEKQLLTREQIEALEGLRKIHFLNAGAQRTQKPLGDITGITGFGFHIIEVEPGYASTEPHRHFYEDECVYILEGEAEATIGGRACTVRAGDFIGYPSGGQAHCLKNTGAEPLRCIVVGERRDHDVCDYPEKQIRLYRNKGLEWNVVAHQAINDHGDETDESPGPESGGD